MELVANSRRLDIAPDEKISYTKQVNDIADIATVNVSYTNSFKLPKTPNNTQVLEQLGQASDGSLIPYSQIIGQLISNGITLINKGWFTVKNTANEYNVYLQDGIIDFFNIIKGRTFGADIQLTEIEHTKNVATVRDSVMETDYHYLIGDYGGEVVDVNQRVNIDFQVPSIRLGYLWDKIFNTLGFTYSGSIFALSDFTEAWISYPKDNGATVTTHVVEFTKDDDTVKDNFKFVKVGGIWKLKNQSPLSMLFDHDLPLAKWGQTFSPDFPILVCSDASNYKFTVSCQMMGEYRYYKFPFTNHYEIEPCLLKLYINNQLKATVPTNGTTVEFVQPFDIGAVIKIEIEPDPQYMGNFGQLEFDSVKLDSWNSISIDIGEATNNPLEINDALKDLTPENLIREVMWRFALTPIIDNEERHIDFYMLDEILDLDNAEDWSEYYIRRTNEVYTIGAYAQNNRLEHKYFTIEQGYNDGIISINNANLNYERSILQSKFFAPDEEINLFGINPPDSAKTFRQTALWTTEVKDNNGVPEISYKAETNRFFWLKAELFSENISYSSPNLGETGAGTSFYIAKTEETTFDYFVEKYHQGHIRQLNQIKIHTIELRLTASDLNKVDFTTVKYFKQEQQYYRLNRITYKDNDIAIGEFIRIRYGGI